MLELRGLTVAEPRRRPALEGVDLVVRAGELVGIAGVDGNGQRELAEAVGVNPQTIGFLERGDYKPSLELAMSLAEVFGVSVELLFSFEPFPSLSQALQKGRE